MDGLGGILGSILGGVGGAMVGGPPGAAIGSSLGGSVGGMFDGNKGGSSGFSGITSMGPGVGNNSGFPGGGGGIPGMGGEQDWIKQLMEQILGGFMGQESMDPGMSMPMGADMGMASPQVMGGHTTNISMPSYSPVSLPQMPQMGGMHNMMPQFGMGQPGMWPGIMQRV